MNNNLLYTVEDKPPFGLSLLLAAQHLLAALGGIIAVPLVIGNVLKLPTSFGKRVFADAIKLKIL